MTALFSWYRYRFGENGNVSAIPDTVQGGGELSLQEGWSSDYDLDLATQTNAKAISRTQHNQLWQGITGNINFWQQNLYPLYTPAASNGGTAVAYPFGTRVRFDAGSGLNVYEVINAAGTNSLPSSAANWVLVSTGYPRSGTASGQQRTNSQNDSRFLIGGTGGSQIRNNAQNEALFQPVADYISSSNSNVASRGALRLFGRGVTNNVSRTGANANLFSEIGTDFGVGNGSSTFGLPPRAPVPGSVISLSGATYSTFGTYPGTSPVDVAVNTSNDDVWVVDSSSAIIYRRAGGSGAWSSVGTFPGTTPVSIDVNSITGDVWVVDAVNSTVYKLTGGSGSYVATGSISATLLQGIAVDDVRGDVFVISDATGNTLFKLPSGAGTFQAFGGLTLTNPRSVAVNSFSHDVFVTDSTTDSVYRSIAGSSVFNVSGTYPANSPRGITASSQDAGVWISDGVGDDIYFLDVDTEAYTIVGSYTGSDPGGLSVSGNTVYITDNVTNSILQLTGIQSSPEINWYIKT